MDEVARACDERFVSICNEPWGQEVFLPPHLMFQISLRHFRVTHVPVVWQLRSTSFIVSKTSGPFSVPRPCAQSATLKKGQDGNESKNRFKLIMGSGVFESNLFLSESSGGLVSSSEWLFQFEGGCISRQDHAQVGLGLE